MPNYNFRSLTKYYWTVNYKITLSNSVSFKEKKNREKETVMKEESPVFLAQTSSPARMGFQEPSLHFRAEGKVLEHPSGHVLTLSGTVTFTSLQDGETAFQSTAPGEDAGTCQLALAL